MNRMVRSGSGERAETIMLYAVLSQSIWGLLQIMLVDVFGYPEDFGNRIRVILVASTMGYAILYGFIKCTRRFVIAYILALFVLLITMVLFPENEGYLMSEALRLTLPLVLPSFLCLSCVQNFDKIEKIFYNVSWVSVLLSSIYAFQLVTGRYVFSNYSMSLSFSLLLPTLVLYSHKNIISIAASVFLFIIIVFMGSRSAAVVIVVYVLLELLLYNKKAFLPVAIIAVLGILYLNSIIGVFERFGIESRTLLLLQSDERLIGHLSHRDEIYDVCIEKIKQNALLGVGLYGDRLFLNGSTSHNFIIEVLLNFGIVIGGGLVILLSFYLVETYRKLPKDLKAYFVRYFCAVMIPLMVSGSYLKDYNLGLFLGICSLLNSRTYLPQQTVVNV